MRAPKLSGGMRRRLLLARALMHEPRLVILDEPTAGVDFELRLELWRYIRRLHDEGTTILLTTHYLEEAEELCEDIALIRDGRLLARDTPRACATPTRPSRWPTSTSRRWGREHGTAAGWRRREVLRVFKTWTQTVVAPVLSSFLFILVFGLSLGGRIKHVDGFDYDVFIVPGLITMAMVQAAYSNNSSSIFQARFDRYLNDMLAAPMRNWEVNLGFSLGGAVRALTIGAALAALAVPVTGVPVREPLVLALAVALALVLFSSLGVVVGIYAETFDHHTFVNNIVILPLSFLGGVFYSVDRLPSPWLEISHLNPVFYLVRPCATGSWAPATSVALALGITAALAAGAAAWSSWLFATGRRIKA